MGMLSKITIHQVPWREHTQFSKKRVMLDSLLEELIGQTGTCGILMNQSDCLHVVPQDGQFVDSRCVKLLRHLQ